LLPRVYHLQMVLKLIFFDSNFYWHLHINEKCYLYMNMFLIFTFHQSILGNQMPCAQSKAYPASQHFLHPAPQFLIVLRYFHLRIAQVLFQIINITHRSLDTHSREAYKVCRNIYLQITETVILNLEIQVHQPNSILSLKLSKFHLGMLSFQFEYVKSLSQKNEFELVEAKTIVSIVLTKLFLLALVKVINQVLEMKL